MSNYASSSRTSTLPTSSSQPVTQNDSRATVVGIVLGVVGALLVVGVVYATWRMRRKRSPGNADGMESSLVYHTQGTSLDQSHPAARITPFGSPEGETPRFKHTPGADMRIAMRRPDGAWHFADPRMPFTPTGVSEIDVMPSPSSSTITLPPMTRTKEHEAKTSRDLRSGYGHDYDVDVSPPPPAYGYDYSGYLKS